jgi:membrane protein YqaA with SNARE-associated domain
MAAKMASGVGWAEACEMDKRNLPHSHFIALRILRALPLPYNGSLSFHKLWLKLTAWIAALKTLGAWGLLLSATIDSMAIPIPVDALIATYAYSTPHKAWLYCVAAAAGSALGSLLPYGLGRAGGELFLLKRIDERRLQTIRDRFERQEFLALMVPAILPPPTPFKLFVFSAGVFEMKVLNFLLAIATGRLIRYGILSVLTVIFGPQIVTETASLFRQHPLLLMVLLVAVIAGIFVIFRLLRAPAAEVAAELKRESAEHDGNKPRG